VRFLGLKTQIVQMPAAENGMVAVVHATARWLNADGDLVEFDGIGDASPTNVKGVGKDALLRMADTRARGRALRDSVNIGEVLEEELSEEEPAPRSQPTSHLRSPVAAVAQPVDVNALRAEVERALAADAEAASKLPKSPADMNEAELSKTLAWLSRRARALSSPAFDPRPTGTGTGNAPEGTAQDAGRLTDMHTLLRDYCAEDPEGAGIMSKGTKGAAITSLPLRQTEEWLGWWADRKKVAAL
jgi:hypothetical protein